MGKINYEVIGLNLVALVFLVLTFVYHWMFVIGAVFFTGWGYKKLMR